tara:strand:- start:66879 stop:67211 length:333 start_codon:yes stop_codon:yes gene_type:complete
MFAVIDPGLEQPRIFENCFVWQRAEEEKAYLIPDGFDHGAFHIDDSGSMVILDRSPVEDFYTAKAGIILAVRRFLDLKGLHTIQSQLAHRDAASTRVVYGIGKPTWPPFQ